MPLVCPVKHGDWHSVELAIRQIVMQLGPQAAATFAKIVLDKMPPNRLVALGADSELTATNLASWVQEGSGIEVLDNGNGTITITCTAESGEGDGIAEVANEAARLVSDARVVYQQDNRKLYLRRT